VGTLLCMSLQARKDLDGGMSGLHFALAQWMFWPIPYLIRKASLKVKSSAVLLFQTSLSSLQCRGRITCIEICLRPGKVSKTKSGKFQWWLWMKSLTVVVRLLCKWFGRLRVSTMGSPHQESSQKLIFSPFPTTQLKFAFKLSISNLTLLQIEEKMWWDMTFLPLNTLLEI